MFQSASTLKIAACVADLMYNNVCWLLESQPVIDNLLNDSG